MLIHSTDLDKQATRSADMARGFFDPGSLLCMRSVVDPEEKHGKQQQMGSFEHGPDAVGLQCG